MEGIFITIEGPDGAGKTSVIKEIAPTIELQAKVPVLFTREPGGIPIAESIREIILDPKNAEMDERTEALLYAAARRQHLIQKVIPSIQSGDIVICDRFVDSSLAYQGAGRGIGIDKVALINQFATDDVTPDLTIYLDVDSDTGLHRIQKGRKIDALDRLDVESPQFHQRVRHAYLKLAKSNPERIVTVDARQSLDKVVAECYKIITTKYAPYFR